MEMFTDWHGWEITDEQAKEIREGNAEARARFYTANLVRIRKMAYGYTHKHPRERSFVEDMIQGVFIDLTVFESKYHCPVTDGVSLSQFIYRSFAYAKYGGLAYLSKYNPKKLGDTSFKIYFADTLSLEKPFGKGDKRRQDDENARTLADVIPAPDAFGIVDYTDDLKRLVSDFLNPREREYFDLFADGYGNKVISEKMGYKSESNNGVKVFEKLRAHSSEILARLAALGVNIDGYKNKTPYNPKTERRYKLAPEVRAYWAQKARERRARKKGIKPDLPPAA